jgi:hypothetical protein
MKVVYRNVHAVDEQRTMQKVLEVSDHIFMGGQRASVNEIFCQSPLDNPRALFVPTIIFILARE